MKVSVCVTMFNEKEEDIKKLLDALEKQTLKADEIIIVEKNSKNQKLQNSKQVKIFNFKNISRAEGRNIAIQKARNEVIAITDVGCVPHREWVEEITRYFEIATPLARNDTLGKIATPLARNDTVVAGVYEMVAKSNFQKACSVFLGIKQKEIDENFMPSARSMAFTKTIWKKAGGFPEELNDTAEDTVFNLRLIKAGAKFVVAKNAIVDWQIPNSISNFKFKIYNYAKGDALSGVWWHPVKKWKTHNIKILTIFARYFLAFLFLVFSVKLFLLYTIFYILYSANKAGLWGIPLQFVSDFAVMSGFLSGIRLLHFVRNDIN